MPLVWLQSTYKEGLKMTDSLNKSPASSLLETDYSIDLNEVEPQSGYTKPRYNQVNHDFCNLNTAKPQSDYEHIDFKGLGSVKISI
jgi:hypothetical protein